MLDIPRTLDELSNRYKQPKKPHAVKVNHMRKDLSLLSGYLPVPWENSVLTLRFGESNHFDQFHTMRSPSCLIYGEELVSHADVLPGGEVLDSGHT